ncbi:lipocalin-like domain-containing protein [Aquimarina aquimarini]|uniref:lipocalin-like domain-containing protein n=1 Tax=Aquimarina aquimarini TaxID=1191734 RepID=UPI000D554B5D|nr:glycoside hydrolase family 43 C-terminal domain-containing protein [Aquimarina aquimarini]
MRIIVASVIVIFLSFGFTTIHKRKKIVGYWEIYKVEVGSDRTIESRNKYIILHEDGRLEGGRIGRVPKKKGAWKYDRKNNILTLSSEKKNKDDGDYGILQLDHSQMKIKKDSVSVFLEKMDKNPLETKD